jgi:hypothetical protein
MRRQTTRVAPEAHPVHEITGTIELSYDRSGAKPNVCICCPDFPAHVFAVGLQLDPYPNSWPEHFHAGRDLNLWVKSMVGMKHLEGRRLRVTVQVVG